jgi:TPR repeat protein
LSESDQAEMEIALGIWHIAGDAPSMFNIGLMYRGGCGVTQSNMEAFHWYERAAQLGHPDAQNNLAYMYQHGNELGTPCDMEEALKWYHAASDQESPDALYNIGLMHMRGDGVEKNVDEAHEWYFRGWEVGSQDALAALQKSDKPLFNNYHDREIPIEFGNEPDFYAESIYCRSC